MDDEFRAVIKNSPLPSIDLIVSDKQGKILLGCRKNRPAKGTWFVPGGRIRKGESIEEGLARILDLEIRLSYEEFSGGNQVRFKGVFEHRYDNENFFGDPGYGTNYIVLAFAIRASPKISSLPKDQHSDYRWFAIDELLSSSDVHDNTKDFFRPFALAPDPGIYRALMSHYLHYEGQMWGRTQLLLVVQGAALVVAYQFRGSYLSPILMIGGAVLIAAIWRLIERDKANRDVNLDIMDDLARNLVPSPLHKRPISVRSSVGGLLRPFRGKYVLRLVFAALIILDLALGWVYLQWPLFNQWFPELANGQ